MSYFCNLQHGLERIGETLRWKPSFIAVLAICAMTPIEAHAYVGPGAGISAIGSLIALLAGIFFAIIGFVWYPIKRLRRRKKKAQESKALESEVEKS